MVISDDIKFPRPAAPAPYRPERKVVSGDGVLPIARISAFKREWSRRREEDRRREQGVLPAAPTGAQPLQGMVAQVNSHFADQSISLHLVLSRREGEDVIDVYDCTGSDRCVIIGDVLIDPADLPLLLRKLEQETGLLVDTIS
jgi:hypothetical protein